MPSALEKSGFTQDLAVAFKREIGYNSGTKWGEVGKSATLGH